jgi:hypothetical protein
MAEHEGRALTREDLYGAIMQGAVERVRPKKMTVIAIMAGLVGKLALSKERRRNCVSDFACASTVQRLLEDAPPTRLAFSIDPVGNRVDGQAL